MGVDEWSDKVLLAHLAEDPQFTEDMSSLDISRQAKPDADIVLDLSGVRFINSSNIARLLKLRKQIAGSDCRLVLCGMNNQVWNAFLVTGLDKIFEFTANVPTALATLQMEGA